MYKKKQLKNGLKMVVSPMPQMSSVSMGVWIGIGGRYEKKDLSGMGHLVEHMLFKGTYERSAEELKRSIEGIGGSFNGFTSDEVTCYMVKVPAKYLELGMDILADMVFNARFDESEIAKEKFVICEEIKMYKDQPADHVMDLLGGIMWPNNPLGRPLTGSISTVKSFKRDKVIAFRDNNYHPGNMAVTAAGKVVPDKAFRYISESFAKRKKKKNPVFKTPVVDQRSPRTKFFKSDTQQTHVAFGFPLPGRDMRERFALKLMNVILGGNMSSRLFEELREKYGLCYDISSSYKRHSDIGEAIIHAGVDSRKVLKSIVAILDELRKIRDLGVTGDELQRAKEYAKGQFQLAMEGTATRMLWLGDRLMVHRRIPEVQEVLKRLDDVDVYDIKKVCEKTFKASFVNLAVIGKLNDKEKNNIRKELDKL
ncbi:MAG: M16 family metallopeptidase [Candidatus Omnitrophota bacterium]